MAYCPKCGREVPASSVFCPSCGSSLNASTSPLQSAANIGGNHPKLAYYLSLVGGIIVFLVAIAYFVAGNAVAGVLGIIFGVLAAYFGRRGYLAKAKQDKLISGMIPMIVGFIVMGAGGALLSDYIVIFGGLLMTLGGILATSGK